MGYQNYGSYSVHKKWYQSNEILEGFSAPTEYSAEKGPEEAERDASVNSQVQNMLYRLDNTDDLFDKSEAQMSELVTTIVNLNEKQSRYSSTIKENCKVNPWRIQNC